MSGVRGRPDGAPAQGRGALSSPSAPADPDHERCDPVDPTGHRVDPLGKTRIAWMTSRKGLSILETSISLWTDFLDGITAPHRVIFNATWREICTAMWRQ